VLRGEMGHPDGYIFIHAMRAEDNYCTVLLTVQWYQYFVDMYSVMDSDTREIT
jgi:hypothetical protein